MALFTVTRTRGRPACPAVNERVRKSCRRHSGAFLSHKKNEVLPCATAWLDLEGITLSEMSQRKTNTLGCHLYMESKKKKANEQTKQKQTQDIERTAQAGAAHWTEHRPANQRVTSSIPSQGTCLGCRPGPQEGAHERQPHTDVSLPLFLPPSPSL